MKTLHSFSAIETKSFGESLAKKIITSQHEIKNRPSALVIAMSGDLGAGKTTFTQGFSKGLGVKKRVISPTFVIAKKFTLPAASHPSKFSATPSFKFLWHIDAYRLKGGDDLLALGFEKIFSDPRNIVLIEWPEKVKTALPKKAIRLKFSHARREGERTIRF